MNEAFTEYGVVEDSGAYTGLPPSRRRVKMAAKAEAEGFGEAANYLSH